MGLLEFQTALGRSVRADTGRDPTVGVDLSAGERDELAAAWRSPGFRVTVDVQRSWCESRAAKSARLTLSALPAEERERVLRDWVDAGGGTASFYWDEAEAFLRFIADRLPNPSHALSICLLEHAALRAATGALYWDPPAHLHNTSALNVNVARGRYASLVPFHGDPQAIVASAGAAAWPPFASDTTSMLLAPGITGLVRVATEDECALWNRLRSAARLAALLDDRHRRETVAALVDCGALETSGP